MYRQRAQEFADFYRRIGRLNIDSLQQRGIEPDTVIGRFYVEREQEVIEICKERPDLHIISQLGKTDVNRYVPGAGAYFLGDGDKDPLLEWTHRFPTLEECAEMLEEALKVPELERPIEDRFGIKLVQAMLAGADVLDAKVITKLIDKNGKEIAKN